LTIVRAAGPRASSAAFAAKAALDCCAVAPSFQVTVSFSRAFLAAHHVSPTMATPPSSRLSAVPPSTTNAWRTPGSLEISSALELATFPPNTGHFTNTA
jgi:hypothetical protein